MYINKITAAITEAERFLVTAKEAQIKWEKDYRDFEERMSKQCHGERFSNTSIENATCKRSSMDLTRALARLRDTK